MRPGGLEVELLPGLVVALDGQQVVDQVGDLLVVRLQGVLTAAEQHLVTTLPAEKGRDLLKQVRTQLLEVARPALESLVRDITGVRPRSLHHDISTLTGEEVVIFTLAETPQFREPKKR